MNEHTAPSTALSTMVAASMPLPPEIKREFQITEFDWRVLVDQIFPTANRPEPVAMALSYCRSRKLDIFKKPVHIVPMYSSALKKTVETVWPGISEIRTTAARTGEYAGLDTVEWGDIIETTFTGQTGRPGNERKIEKTVRYPEWARITCYRIVKGARCAFTAEVYWEEAFAAMGKSGVPNEMWAKRPRGQLAKCVEAAVLRMTFPEEVGSMYAAEEMEGRVIDHVTTEMRVAAAAASSPPDPDGDIVDVEVEDIVEGGRGGAPDPDGDHADDDGAPDPDAGDGEPASPRQAILDKLSDDLGEAKAPDDVQKVWLHYGLDAIWGDGDADHKADLRIARGLMNQRDRELQKAAKK
jgi:phage recombination protein Bet